MNGVYNTMTEITDKLILDFIKRREEHDTSLPEAESLAGTTDQVRPQVG